MVQHDLIGHPSLSASIIKTKNKTAYETVKNTERVIEEKRSGSVRNRREDQQTKALGQNLKLKCISGLSRVCEWLGDIRAKIDAAGPIEPKGPALLDRVD